MKNSLLMIGPDPQGLGGISNVVSLWQKSGMFDANCIEYIPTVNDKTQNKLLFLIGRLPRFLLSLPGKNIVYIHTASSNSFYRKSLFIVLGALLGKKVILHIHPSNFYYFVSNLIWLPRRIAFWLLGCVDAFVVLVEDMQQKITSWFPNKPVCVLPNPVDVQGMSSSESNVRDRNRILFLGWLNRGKGVYDLVDAAKILEKERVDFVIDFFGTKEVEQLKSYILNEGLERKLTVHGWADEQRKLVALHKSTALILPSHTEGIPNVILEAMASKIPIISTRVGGLLEILRDGENAVIIEPGNPQDIAEKIKFVFNNRLYCQNIAERSYLEVCKKYDLPIIKKRFEEMLEHLI